MNRYFFGVGQGAFYYEKFNEASLQVIYDCGSFSKKCLNKVINEAIEKKYLDTSTTTTTAIFISHFHLDHINGIPTLIEKLNVKYIFFPYLTPSNRKILIAYNKYLIGLAKKYQPESDFSGDEKFITNFIAEPYKTINTIKGETEENKNEESKTEKVQLYCIKPYNNTCKVMPNDSWEKIEKINSGKEAMTKILEMRSIDWQYLTYNLNGKDKLRILKKKFTKAFGRKISLNEINNVYKKEKNRKVIDSIFRNLGELNTNSMILFSLGESAKPAYICCDICDKQGDNKEIEISINKISSIILGKAVVFLYLGDYNAKKNFSMIQKIGDTHNFWNIDKIMGFQVPHHGSKHSFSEDLAGKCKFCIISADPSFVYHHPDGYVKDFLEKKEIPFLVLDNVTMCQICS